MNIEKAGWKVKTLKDGNEEIRVEVCFLLDNEYAGDVISACEKLCNSVQHYRLLCGLGPLKPQNFEEE